VNRETGEVKYGLDSLLMVLGNRFRWLGAIAGTQPLKFFIQKFYNFISYNRKVIMPAPPKASGMYDCTPTFKLKYRLAYIMVVWLLTSLTLVEYSQLLRVFIPATDFFREFLICGGQVVFQTVSVGLVAWAQRREMNGQKLMDYLGNMMTVSMFGAILLLPALLIGNLISGIHAVAFLVYFMAVVFVMLYEHARRMEILGLGWWPSMSWVLYRILVLGIIFYKVGIFYIMLFVFMIFSV
jgi:hypothetical protein